MAPGASENALKPYGLGSGDPNGDRKRNGGMRAIKN
jgi:hypothetical protein